MPTPTKPPWSGSWPEPPPEMRPTLPATGAVGSVDHLALVVDPQLRVGGLDAGQCVGHHGAWGR